jgi:hypothetical protein
VPDVRVLAFARAVGVLRGCSNPRDLGASLHLAPRRA